MHLNTSNQILLHLVRLCYKMTNGVMLIYITRRSGEEKTTIMIHITWLQGNLCVGAFLRFRAN